MADKQPRTLGHLCKETGILDGRCGIDFNVLVIVWLLNCRRFMQWSRIKVLARVLALRSASHSVWYQRHVDLMACDRMLIP